MTAVPGAVPTFRLNFEESFRAVARDPNWLAKIALGAVFMALSVVIIGTILVEGYLLIYIDRVSRAEARPLPEWEDFGEILRRGLGGFLVRIVYSLPILLIVVPLVLLGTLVPFLVALSSSGGSTASGAGAFAGVSALFTLCGVALIIPVALLVQVLTPAAHAQLVLHNGELGAAFNLGVVGRFIGRHKGQYALMVLLTFAAGSVLNQIGQLACIVGVFATSFLVQLFTAHMIGQFCWYERNVLQPAGAQEGRRA